MLYNLDRKRTNNEQVCTWKWGNILFRLPVFKFTLNFTFASGTNYTTAIGWNKLKKLGIILFGMHVNPTIIHRQRTMQKGEHNVVKGHVEQTRNKQKKDKISVSCIPFNKSFMED